MRRFLAREGLDVLTAANGEEALRLAREHKPAAITLDVLMPGMDGWDVLRELQNDADLAAIPVIMLSMLDERTKGYALGASDYMTKPIDRDRLASISSSAIVAFINMSAKISSAISKDSPGTVNV